jgi:hypothetical protein
MVNRNITIITIITLFLRIILTGIIACNRNESTAGENPVEPLPQVAVTAHHNMAVSSFNIAKVLNADSGGHGINTELNWIPRFYQTRQDYPAIGSKRH